MAATMFFRSPALSVKSAFGAALFAALATIAPAAAGAGSGPDAVADLVAPLLDAVVNISTAQTIAGTRGAEPPPADAAPKGIRSSARTPRRS